jgi:hypothetical protein
VNSAAPVRSPSQRTSLLMGCVLLPLLGCCALCGIAGYWVTSKSDREALEVAERDIAALKPQLARTYGGVPAPGQPTIKPCLDTEISAGYASERSGSPGQVILWIGGVSHELLGKWIATGLAPGERDEWMWMTSSSIRDVFDPSRYDLPRPGENIQGEVRRLRDSRYLVVFRATSKALPNVTGEGATIGPRKRLLEKSKSFTAGVFHGSLVVMDLASASPVCWAALDVESSDSLKYRTYGLMSQRPQDVATDDFKDRWRQASREALGRISTLLQIAL